jgi:hypothetical protein
MIHLLVPPKTYKIVTIFENLQKQNWNHISGS